MSLSLSSFESLDRLEHTPYPLYYFCSGIPNRMLRSIVYCIQREKEREKAVGVFVKRQKKNEFFWMCDENTSFGF